MFRTRRYTIIGSALVLTMLTSTGPVVAGPSNAAVPVAQQVATCDYGVSAPALDLSVPGQRRVRATAISRCDHPNPNALMRIQLTIKPPGLGGVARVRVGPVNTPDFLELSFSRSCAGRGTYTTRVDVRVTADGVTEEFPPKFGSAFVAC